MDFIENLAKQASQITMYDVKSYYNSAKNAVLNIPEMEAKVREATNEDPWGASSTLMQEIAQGTHNFQNFNEIMPTIYSRFMEKEAREWRQIYKALQLLEYLIKHGSERVVDDARAHISTIKMLRNFHYIDDKGKDQGINVRNRANEIASLLSDVDRIRQERRKARANRNKYQGREGGAGGFGAGGGFGGTGNRYGGFGSDSFAANSAYGGGGGGSGSGNYGGGGDDYSGRQSSAPREPRQSYDEYEGADDFEDVGAPPRRGSSRAGASASGSSSRASARPKSAAAAKEPPKAKQPEVNLFDFDDEPAAAPPAPAAAPVASAPVDAFGDDDFDDFQQGPSSPVAVASPIVASPAKGGANANLFALLESSSPSVPSAKPAAPTAAAPMSANPPAYGSSFGQARSPVSSVATKPQAPAAAPSQPKKPASTFDDLWTTSLSTTTTLKPTAAPAQGKSIAQMEKEKAMNGLWGAATSSSSSSAPKPAAGANATSGGDLDDLLL